MYIEVAALIMLYVAGVAYVREIWISRRKW